MAPGPHGAPTRSTLFDQSPLIAEVLRQISASTTSLQDLRNQFSEYQASSSQSREILNLELDTHRERKRQEDASRTELKTKTKNLDDQKRTAEGHKREAERKLKATRTTHDKTINRIEFLDKETAILQERANTDLQFLSQKSVDTPEIEIELSKALDHKKTEIKAAEEELLAVNRRSRELEEKLAMERERLEVLRQRAESRMNHQTPSAAAPGQTLLEASEEGFYALHAPAIDTGHLFQVHDHSASYGLDSSSSTLLADGSHASLLQYGTYLEGSPLADSPPYEITGYSGSNEVDISPSTRRAHYSPIGQPSSDHLLEFAASIQMENDPGFDQSWNSSLYSLTSVESPLTATPPYGNLDDERATASAVVHDQTQTDHAYTWPQQNFGSVDELGYHQDGYTASFAAGGRQKKGLNPGAKAFSLPWKLPSAPDALLNSTTTFDALNPNGLVNNTLPSASSHSDSLLRAFAPSRAEREALQRALGGSTNSSFERLPSLSEVGSIPPSPSHAHASALSIDSSYPSKDAAAVAKSFHLPSWLTGLPNIRKSRFRPWDDEEPSLEAVSQKA